MPLVAPEIAHRQKFPAAKGPRIVIDCPVTPPATSAESTLLLRILSTSVLVHLLLIGFLGAGLPKVNNRPKRVPIPPTAATLIEDVKLQEEPPPEEPKPLDKEEPLPLPDVPPPSAVDLPRLSQVPIISAVPSTVPVAFGIEAKGRVRLVSDASQASGSAGTGRAPTQPVAIDGNASQARNLLLPTVTYPADAVVRRLQGTVVLEFRTTDTGEITAVKVRISSGYPILDRAALNNLALGRWLGRSGYFLKTYEFKLN